MTDQRDPLTAAVDFLRLPKGHDARRGPDLPPEECEVLDQTLAEYAGHLAWIGIAWRPKDRSHPYYAGLRELQDEWAAEQRERLTQTFTERLPARYRRYTFDTLRRHPGNAAAIDAAKALQPGQNLYLWGPAGNGKTHLAVATGRRLAEAGHRVAFYGVVALFAQIRASFAPDGAPRPDLAFPDVLILDDLGKVKPTEFVYQEFYAALEARWANEKSTVFTANHRPSAAAEHLSPDSESAAAILSRMASGVVVEVRGRDERLPR
ncbi:MAG TPA: ATP-binding protein [Trueperaceae bacterium]